MDINPSYNNNLYKNSLYFKSKPINENIDFYQINAISFKLYLFFAVNLLFNFRISFIFDFQ